MKTDKQLPNTLHVYAVIFRKDNDYSGVSIDLSFNM